MDELRAVESQSGDTHSDSRRNLFVETAIQKALSDIDNFYAKQKSLILPPQELKILCDEMLDKPTGTRISCLFFAYYSLEDEEWGFTRLPVGARGKYGDKLLCSELVGRNATIGMMTSNFESIGTKGNVNNFNLQEHRNFGVFLKGLQKASPNERRRVAEYLAWRFASSIKHQDAVPPLDPTILTYAKAKLLFHALLKTKSAGYIQQFVVAALLNEHRKRQGTQVRTHKVHAADKYDRTAGDIEEFRGGRLIGAYEVTVRDDWKNRIHVFTAKMDEYNLNKYVIIASDVNNDPIWGVPAAALIETSKLNKDIAVVDIEDFINVFLAELSSAEIVSAINTADVYLRTPELCGVPAHIETFSRIVSEWLGS